MSLPTVNPQMQEAMRRAMADASKKAGADRTFYSPDAKERLYNEVTPLYAHSFKRSTGKFGDRWLIVLTEDSPKGEGGTLELKANDYRDTLFANFATIAAQSKWVGPLMLAKRELEKQPNPAWDLVPWTVDGRTEAAPDMDELPF